MNNVSNSILCFTIILLSLFSISMFDFSIAQTSQEESTMDNKILKQLNELENKYDDQQKNTENSINELNKSLSHTNYLLDTQNSRIEKNYFKLEDKLDSIISTVNNIQKSFQKENCTLLNVISTSCELSNDYTLLVEIFIASFAIIISFMFYRNEKSGRKQSDELIKAQANFLRIQDNLRNQRIRTGLGHIEGHIQTVIDSLKSINAILKDSTNDNKLKEKLQKYLEQNKDALKQDLAMTSYGVPGFVDEDHQLWILTKGWINSMEAALDYVKGDIDPDLYSELLNWKINVAFYYNFEFGVGYVIAIDQKDRDDVISKAEDLKQKIDDNIKQIPKHDENIKND